MKIFGITVLVILGFIVFGAIGTALNLITIPWLKFDRQVQLNRDLVNKTYNVDNALYNYHWFQEKSGAIIALRTQIKQADQAVINFEAVAGPHDKWTFEDKNEDARLRAVKQGQQAQYESLVNEYNARANEADRAIFKDGLPTFFSLQPF